jgi:hypothetical protein
MQVYVATLSEDLRSDLKTVEDLNVLIKTNAKKPDSYFSGGEYALKKDWAMVMMGGNKSIREELEPYEDSAVTARQQHLGLYICRRKKSLGKDMTYVVMQPLASKWKYCDKYVMLAKPVEHSDKYRITMKEVIEALDEAYQ